MTSLKVTTKGGMSTNFCNVTFGNVCLKLSQVFETSQLVQIFITLCGNHF